jgi:hypothetical protein
LSSAMYLSDLFLNKLLCRWFIVIKQKRVFTL